MAAWSFRSSYESPAALNLAPEIGSNVKCPLPKIDYYINQDRGIGTDDDQYNLANDGPVARCIVESGSKIYIERNLYSHLNSTYKEKLSFYQDEDMELHTLAIKPPTFIIFGKPGVGTTTLAKKIAQYLNCIYLSPASIIEYYQHHFIPEDILPGSIQLGQSESPPDNILLSLFQARMMELDILHRGYVLEGLPRFSEDSNVEFADQLEIILSFDPKPEYVIVPHMQNVDLFKRRVDQKVDVETNQKYTKNQYYNKEIESFDDSQNERVYYQRKKRKHSIDIDSDTEFIGLTSMVYSQSRPDLTTKDSDSEYIDENDQITLRAIPSSVILRLVTSDDDSPYNIEKSFVRYRQWLPYLQAYIDLCDVRKVLELNAYWAPPIMMKMVLEFIDNYGLTPAPLPVKLVNEVVEPRFPLFDRGEADEIGPEEDEGPFLCSPTNAEDLPTDWAAILRACTLRSRVDPRFRWRLSRWKNLCPVALKHGRSLTGKPEFAIGFLGRIYFLSCKEAYQQFEFNPRPFLLPTMPRSPVKFFVVGHPLAGKSLFSKRLAEHCGGIVIDMKREFRKRYNLVKFDYLFRVRLQATFQAMKNIDHENYENWKRQELKRRVEIMDWIEKFVRRKADSELNSLLKMEKEERDARRAELYLSCRDHQLSDVLAGQCTTDKGGINFNWMAFVEELREGRRNFTHQQRLELAWNLFREGKLYYKKRAAKQRLLHIMGQSGSQSTSSMGWNSGSGGYSGSGSNVDEAGDEYKGESDEVSSEEGSQALNKKPKRRVRRRKPCIPAPKKEVEEEKEEEAPYLGVVEEKESSVFGLDEETDESLKMRFPELPAELIDSIPRPPSVADDDELVLEYVENKLAQAEAWATEVPPILYVELLRRVLRETEAKYLESHATGPLTGGWVIDNLPDDIEKWRAILRTPDTCPDNVIALVDNTPDYSYILNRLKASFLKSEANKSSKGINFEETLGEYDEIPLTSLQKEKRISSTELLISMLPLDDLNRKFSYEFTQSQLSQLKRDLDRQISLADSELDISADYKKLLEAWFKTFEINYNNRLISEGAKGDRHMSSIGSENRVKSRVTIADPNSLTSAVSTKPTRLFSQHREDDSEKSQWTLRNINYEMLTYLDAPETAGGYSTSDDESSHMRTSIRDGTQSSVYDIEMKRLKDLHLEEFLGEEINISEVPSTVSKLIFEQGGEDGGAPSLEIKSPRSDEYIRTPTGLLSQPDILCDLPPEDGPLPTTEGSNVETLGEGAGDEFRRQGSHDIEILGEDGTITKYYLPEMPKGSPPEPCVPNLHSPSIRRKFLQQIHKFNTFWLPIVPIMNQQQVHYFQVGVVNEDTVFEKIHMIWDELESRFSVVPKDVTEGDLFDEDESWLAADKKWKTEEELDRKRRENVGKPYKPYDTAEQLGESTQGGAGDIIDTESQDLGTEGESEENEGLGEFDTENEDSDDVGSTYLSEKERSKLAKLAKTPEKYLEFLNTQKGMRLFGDSKDYCPVTLHELGLIRKGTPKFSLKYRDRLYYFTDEDSYNRFREKPLKFLPKKQPLNVPPPRICITGSPGCGQEEVGLEMCREYELYYFNFRQRLHEIIRVKLGKDVGPESINDTLRKDGSLLGLKSSDSDFDIPSTVLLASQNNNNNGGEYEGENDGYNAAKESEFYSIGVDRTAHIFECPINSIKRTEAIAERNWKLHLNLIETSIKEFLENGDQLSDEVLDEFIAPLWLDEPFKSKGFLMIGFPNSEQDVEYLIKRNLVPEYVYILDSKPKTMRNRLITRNVDDWHLKHPKKSSKSKPTGPAEPQEQSKKGKMKKKLSLFNSQTVKKVVRDKNDEKEAAGVANFAWSYKDSLSMDISTSLYHYHELYSKNLNELEISLNSNRIDWKIFHTDFSLNMSKTELKKCLTTSLKYRNSFFESTYPLFQNEALILLERRFFELSKFGRWCPVQISKGNPALNLWNGPGIKKIPVLHRQYIYYIAGEENVEYFRDNVWNLVSQEIPTPTMPLFLVITGPPKSGKTTLAQRLAYKLGLVYISEESMMDEIIKHSFLNKISEEYDLTSTKLSSGPQPMLISDEILAYLRDGYTVPPYMVCRVMDLALMAPRAQFHGVVFDNYPLEESQLQELLERGIVPSVVNLQMELDETIKRCERHQFDPTFNYENLMEESSSLIEHLYEENKLLTAPILHWYQNEMQCLLNIDAIQHPTAIYEKVFEHCCDAMTKLQRYIYNHQTGKPTALDGTTPLTSMLHTKFTKEFGYYDPVALNENNELVQVFDYKDLTKVVEYRDEIYIFSNEKYVKMFLNDPERYTFPTCQNIPPEILPVACILTPDEMKQLEVHWGFLDFDPVSYFEGNFQFKWLQRGVSKYGAEYNGKLYFFVSQENLDKFMKKPYKYCNIPLPTKFPSSSENPLDTVSPPGYLIVTGLSQEICRMLSLLASKRPRFPFMSTSKSGLLYLGYYLKTLNMKAPSELRTHYRKAMAHMTNTQSAVEKLCIELNELHGKRSIPPETKKKLKLLMELAEKPDDEKVLDPYIHGQPFSYECANTSKKTPNLDLLKEILTDDEQEQISLLSEEELEAIEDAVSRITPVGSAKASITSLVDEYVPPPYLAKDKLW